MSDFGAKLRAARERRGVSLRDIANRTKLSMAALESLEKNDVARIPGGIFARALVRSYAGEVGLDPEATVREFVARFNVEPPPSFTAELSAEAPDDPSHRGLTTLLKIVVASLVAVAIIFYLTRVRHAEQSSSTTSPDARRTSRRVVSVVPKDSRP